MCNNNCISCVDDKLRKGREDSVEEIIDTIKKRPEIDTVALTHGEPTIRNDFFTIIDEIQKQKKRIHVLSNGRLFSYSNFIKKFAGYNNTEVNISITIYGHNSRLHDRVTGAPGSFEQTIKGIRKLVLFNFFPEIRVLVNRVNYKYLPKMAELIIKKFKNISQVIFIFPRLTGNAWRNRRAVHVSYRESVPYIQRALDVFGSDYKIALYHFPKCILGENYRHLAAGFTACETELVEYFDFCVKCQERKNCSGVWINYSKIETDKEFSPVT